MTSNRATRKATHTPTTINITIISKDAMPKMAQVVVLTNGMAWAHTDAWKKICESVARLAVECQTPNGQPVFIADAKGTDLGHYTVGEIKNELV